MSLRSPSRWTRLGHYIGPFALLSVLTSVAFNRALLARERVEQRRLHLLQRSLLEQIFHDPHTLGGSSSSSSSSSPSSLEEQRKLARRLRTLQLDPLQLGFSRQVLPSKEEEEKLQRVKQSTTTWGSALFGSGTVARLQHSVKKARQSIRDRGFGFGDSLQSRTMEEEEEDAAWVRELEERFEGIERKTVPSARPTTTIASDIRSVDKNPLQDNVDHIDPRANVGKAEEYASLSTTVPEKQRRHIYM